jgi:hypothetical protein
MFTLLPVRVAAAVFHLISGAAARRGAVVSGSIPGERSGLAPAGGVYLFDILCVVIFAITVVFLQSVNAGSIYYWMKDLTREFLKLQVIHAVLEILDRVRIMPGR